MSEEKKEIAMKGKEEVRPHEGEQTKAGVYYVPACDIFETEEALTLVADLPGVDKGDLEVDVEDRQLTITGHVRQPEARHRVRYTEYGIGGYTRRFTLGDTIDQAKISARLEDGVLILTLPKAERIKPRKVEIAG